MSTLSTRQLDKNKRRAGAMALGTNSAGGGAMGAKSIGGQSAINPQAKGNAFKGVDKYIDQSYDNAMNRLQPELDQSRDRLTQGMIDRGIGVGSEAHNKAMRTQGRVENDATQNAAFQALGMGAGLQNQMFQQDATRSSLANSLLQANNSLNENSRQFNGTMNEQQRQFDNSFLEGMRQYDDGSNLNWDRQAQGWDNAAFRDLSFLDNSQFRNRQYNDSQDDKFFNMRQAMLGAIPGWNPAQIDVNGAAAASTNSQKAAFDAQMQQNNQMWDNIGTAAGAAMMFSDVRLKENIEPQGSVNGHSWFSWDWNEKAAQLGLTGSSEGVLAQLMPDEFLGESGGFLTVDYERVLG